jgi:hypothetical protein
MKRSDLPETLSFTVRKETIAVTEYHNNESCGIATELRNLGYKACVGGTDLHIDTSNGPVCYEITKGWDEVYDAYIEKKNGGAYNSIDVTIKKLI